jgi:hypothetical protein
LMWNLAENSYVRAMIAPRVWLGENQAH